ncbi:MAG: hypothetical protein HC902_14565 [Calothrix sp. SM1_5_4]|nr:hypothetical protein [Calothrix sp. SM1_5_4]
MFKQGFVLSLSVLTLISASAGHAQSSGLLFEDALLESLKTPAKSPMTPVPPVATKPITKPITKPVAKPVTETDDSQTEAGISTGRCPPGVNCRSPGLSRLPTAPQSSSGGQSRAACFRREILKAAKVNVRRRFGNRGYSGGICAYGVRTTLNLAGVTGGSLGDAIDFHRRPNGQAGRLTGLGFRNMISMYPTPQSAPPGAILVFRGPLTDLYLKNGSYPSRATRRRLGVSAGSYVGHVTVKGDDGYYYTDGRTRAPATAGRTLVGVYVTETCAGCSERLKRACAN